MARPRKGAGDSEIEGVGSVPAHPLDPWHEDEPSGVPAHPVDPWDAGKDDEGVKPKPHPLDPWDGGIDDGIGHVPAHPLDPWTQFRRFYIEIDSSISLPIDAVRRIQQRLREAIFQELAGLDSPTGLEIRQVGDHLQQGVRVTVSR